MFDQKMFVIGREKEKKRKIYYDIKQYNYYNGVV